VKGDGSVTAQRAWSASVIVVCLLVLAWAVPAFAQEASTRAEEIARQQEEKARQLAPYRPNRVERRLLEIEEAGGLTALRGWYVAFGDIKQGSGVALGPAYGRILDSGATVAVKGTYSVRNFKLIQLAATAPPLARGRLRVSGRARWQDAPELPVYALGPDAPRIRADFSERRTELSGQMAMRPVQLLRFGGGAAYEAYRTGGASTNRPSVEQRFTPLEMPGIGADPQYLHTFVSAAIDSRPGLGYSRGGTLLEAALHDYRERSGGRYSFQRVDAVARQLVPILHGNWVIDLSVRTSTTSVGDGHDVPFFLLPDLGGAGELRGYTPYRFRDRHAILFTGEYRWYVQEFVDMAVFYDAGKVASRRGDLDLDGLKSNVGIGLRFHGPQTTVLRFEVARGTEGLRFIMAFSSPLP
jgi:hypothetical protein